MALFRYQPVDASVLVWRQGDGVPTAAPGSARPERRFDVLADGVFVWGRRRPTAAGGGFEAAWARNINSVICAGAPR